ncbi:uncharacterized protein LOC143273398 isoform X2 [Peromyscus maniculatus bairdii]|uniref:uncharacterized protein LOC143273398 isoform X2 n=1 Tax=Peromyscus maniculatus bairdii TaxID=230844 RepID=UPI003FD677F5
MMSAIAEISVKVLKKTKNKTNKEKSTKKWHMTQLYDFGYLPEELHPRYQCTSVLVLKVALSTIAKLLSEVHPPHTHPSGFILAQGLRPGITAKELVTIIVILQDVNKPCCKLLLAQLLLSCLPSPTTIDYCS